MIEAVIFDLDGLMVNSTPIQQEASRIFLESFGKVVTKTLQGREGMRIIDIIADYKDIYNLPGTLDELYHKRQQIYFKLARRGLILMPDLLPLLDKIKEKGLRMAIATSGDQEYITLLFEKFPQLKPYFSVIVTSEDVAHGKPYPDVYKKAAEKLGLSTTLCVVIEDSMNGITAAKSAGMQVICVPNENYPDADYSEADKLFSNLSEVAGAIT